MWRPTWHVSVGWVLTGRDGSYCGRVGLCTAAESWEAGWQLALEWLRRRTTEFGFLVHTFDVEVRYF